MSKTNFKVMLPLSADQETVEALQYALHPYIIQAEDRPKDDEVVRNHGTDQTELRFTTDDTHTVWEVLAGLQRQIPSLSWEPKKKERPPEEIAEIRKKFITRAPL